MATTRPWIADAHQGVADFVGQFWHALSRGFRRQDAGHGFFQPPSGGVSSIRYHAPWMAPNTFIEILRDTTEHVATKVFIVPTYMAFPTWAPEWQRTYPGSFSHAWSVDTVTRVEIRGPPIHQPRAGEAFRVPSVDFVNADEVLLVLEFDHGTRGETRDLRPHLPLLLRR